MCARTLIDEHYDRFTSVIQKLYDEGSLSEAQALQDTLRRTFVVGAASFFEQTLKEAILDLVASRSGSNSAVVALVKTAVVERGFHQLFQWDAKNANRFFSYFGADFGDQMKQKCIGDLKVSMQSFMELGNLRNCIVHQNFHLFYFEKTLDECYATYKEAQKFVEFVLASFEQI